MRNIAYNCNLQSYDRAVNDFGKAMRKFVRLAVYQAKFD